MANTDFSSSNVLNIQEALALMPVMNNNVFRTHTPAIGTWRALNENNINAAIYRGVENPDKEISVDVHWFEKTGVEAANVTTTCTPTTVAGGSYKETYTLSKGKESMFSYTSATWRASQFDTEEQYVAAMMVQHMAAIITAINTDGIAFLEAEFGVNLSTELTTNGFNEDEVPTALLNPQLWGYLSRAKELNDMSNAFIVSSSALHQTVFAAGANEDTTARNMVGGTPIYFDLKGLGSDADLPFWLVDPASYAFVSKNRYTMGSAIPIGFDRRAYSLNDPWGYGFTFDVVEKVTCDTFETAKTDVKVICRYDYFANPVSKVNTTNTGILKYVVV